MTNFEFLAFPRHPLASVFAPALDSLRLIKLHSTLFPSPVDPHIRMRTICFHLALLLLFSASLVSQAIGTVTMAESEWRVIRGATLFVGVPGARVNRGDMLETGSRGMTQIEFGPTVIALGPSSRLLLSSYSPSGAGTQAEFVLLTGWLKSELDPKSGAFQFDTPLLAAVLKQGNMVIHAGTDSSEIFLESGSANIGPVTSGGSASQLRPAKAGDFVSRQAGKNLVTANRPAAAFVDSMPMPFRDTLPSHPLKGKAPELSHGRDIDYAQLRPWLSMPPRWRKELVPRFQSRLDDPKFREELAAHVQEYPEWDPVLHPEKYPGKNQ